MSMAEHATGVDATEVSYIIHSVPEAPAIIINYPGYGGSVDGFNGKYKKMAELMVERKLGAVVRMENRTNLGPNYLVGDLRQVLDKVTAHNSGYAKPGALVYLMGASAGAGAIAAVAADYPVVTKILLFEPAGNAGEKIIQQGLARYKGSLNIVVGSGKDAIGEEYASKLIGWARQASRKELVVLPDCDHNFSGERNGMILSKAPFWAFAEGGDPTFPSPKGGTVLY